MFPDNGPTLPQIWTQIKSTLQSGKTLKSLPSILYTDSYSEVSEQLDHIPVPPTPQLSIRDNVRPMDLPSGLQIRKPCVVKVLIEDVDWVAIALLPTVVLIKEVLFVLSFGVTGGRPEHERSFT